MKSRKRNAFSAEKVSTNLKVHVHPRVAVLQRIDCSMFSRKNWTQFKDSLVVITDYKLGGAGGGEFPHRYFGNFLF